MRLIMPSNIESTMQNMINNLNYMLSTCILNRHVKVLGIIGLGAGSKVLMLVHISPFDEDVGETICSLSFAKRARAVETNRELPEVT